MSGPQVLAGVAEKGSPVGVGIDKAVVGGVVYVRAAYVTQAAATTTVGSHNLCPRLVIVLITKIPFVYSQNRNCAGSVPVSTFICVRERFIYSQARSTIFSCSRIGRPICGNI
jgi:hypothetical protein